jgi:hypothetical protein
MKDLFLTVDGISNEEEALQYAINAAVGVRRNKVYKNDEDYEKRVKLRDRWKELLLREAEGYRKPAQAVTDEQHCAAISRIADELSGEFGELLNEGRLRFGISQKAFNLFLKYLWKLGKAGTPPHCPIDHVVLSAVGIDASWTQCDSDEQYMCWINKIRKLLTLAEWENEVWLRWRISNPGS